MLFRRISLRICCTTLCVDEIKKKIAQQADRQAKHQIYPITSPISSLEAISSLADLQRSMKVSSQISNKTRDEFVNSMMHLHATPNVGILILPTRSSNSITSNCQFIQIFLPYQRNGKLLRSR